MRDIIITCDLCKTRVTLDHGELMTPSLSNGYVSYELCRQCCDKIEANLKMLKK